MSDSEDEVLERPAAAEIPVLDRIVKPSKQGDLADLLIKIIQTNEEEDRQSLVEYEADVSSATLRDIDAKLSAALENTDKATSRRQETDHQPATIPMLTEIADFPVKEHSVLDFKITAKKAEADDANIDIDFPLPTSADHSQPGGPLPATSRVASHSHAANSGESPDPANQDYIPEAIFSMAPESTALDDDSFSRAQFAELEARLQQSSKKIIDELVAQHTTAIRAEFEQRLVALRKKLLQDLVDSNEV